MSKTIHQIYSEYQIMPQLQLHQLRVAAVAYQLCLKIPHLHCNDVILACLLHDMGNIIKFDLGYFPDFTAPLGREYWQQVKSSFIQKYGPDEHLATLKIAEELGLSTRAVDFIKSIGFSHTIENISPNILIEKKICAYADQRVGPYGIISLNERLMDGKKRYSGLNEKDLKKYEEICSKLRVLEEQVLGMAKILPSDINDKPVSVYLENLRQTVLF